MRFETPWAFLLLLLIPLPVYLSLFRRGRAAFQFSSTKHAAASGRSLRQRLAFLPTLLRVLAMVLFVVALARPQKGGERVREVSEGVAIEMAVDRSSSMGAEMTYGGEQMNRLDAVKRVFEEFVAGNSGGLDGRPNDLIGLVSFARYPETNCPLTLGHGALSRFLDSVHLAQPRGPEDGTGIGDAIVLAAARLKKAEETLAKQLEGGAKNYDIKSKIIILLTDGQHNCGKRMPLDAAQQAAEWGIKIYTIGVGGGESFTTVQGPFGSFKVPAQSDLDEQTLTGIAEKTGGKYFQAQDAQSLRAVYEEIDKLEKTSVEAVRYVNWREYFVPFAVGGLLLLVVEVLLSTTVFRKVP